MKARAAATEFSGRLMTFTLSALGLNVPYDGTGSSCGRVAYSATRFPSPGARAAIRCTMGAGAELLGGVGYVVGALGAL